MTLTFAAAFLLAGPPRFLGPPEKKPADGGAAVSAGDAAPVFSAAVANARAAGVKRIDLAQLVGPSLAGRSPVKAVLISFYDPHCEACRKELDALDALYAQQKTRGLEVVSVTSDAAALLKRRAVSYPVVIDRAGSITRRYLGRRSQYPAAVLVGTDGKIVSVKAGYRSDPAVLLRAEVDAALR